MIRSSMSTAAAALLILGATSAHAAILNMSFSGAPGQNPLFGGLSFDVNTAATANTFTTGPCVPGGQPSDTYQTFSAAGGISNASLIWNGVDYSLQSSSIFLDPEGPGGASGFCPFALDMTLTFNNGTVFQTEDQPVGVFSASQYTPSQLLATGLLGTYNGPIVAPSLMVQGQGQVLTGFSATTTSVPEPGTLALLGAGLVGMAMKRRKAGVTVENKEGK